MSIIINRKLSFLNPTPCKFEIQYRNMKYNWRQKYWVAMGNPSLIIEGFKCTVYNSVNFIVYTYDVIIMVIIVM